MTPAASGSGWEYLILHRAEVGQLPQLGRLGWELISVTTEPDGGQLYFKRPLPSFREQITLDQRESYVGEDPA